MLETRENLQLWIALAILAVAGTASGLYLNSKVRHQAELSVAKQASEGLSGNIEQVQAELTQLELALATAQSEHEQLIHKLGGQQTAILSLKDSTIIRVESIVLFETGSALIKPTAQSALNIIGEWLEKYPNRNIRIDGHTDDRRIGQDLSQQYPSNWELSVARAEAVKHFILTTHPDVAHERVIALGRGSNHPIATNATEFGRQKNRRVEFFLMPRKDPNILK